MAKLKDLMFQKTGFVSAIISNKPDLSTNLEGKLIWEDNKLILSFSTNMKELANAKNIDRIFGMTSGGENFTLFNLINIGHTFSFPGFPEIKFLITSYVNGIKEENDDYVQSSIELSHISEWLGIHITEYIRIEGSEDLYGSINIRKIPTISVYTEIQDEKVEILFELSATYNCDLTISDVINQKTLITIKPNNSKSKDWFRNAINDLRNLFTILIGHPLEIKYWEFQTDKIKNIEYYESYMYRDEKKKKLERYNMIFDYGKLQNSFKDIIYSWFQLNKKNIVKGIIQLYTSNFYLKQYEENVFLNYMQGLEGYHRAIFGGGYKEQKKFRKEAKKLYEFMEENLEWEEELKDAVYQRIMFGYEYTLDYRLRELTGDLGDELVNLLFGNSERKDNFIRKIKKMRNNLTHPNDKSKTTNGVNDYLEVNNKLKLFFMIIVFKKLGINAKTIKESIQECQTYNWYLPKFNDEKFENKA